MTLLRKQGEKEREEKERKREEKEAERLRKIKEKAEKKKNKKQNTIVSFFKDWFEDATEEDYEMMIDELDDCSIIEEFDLKDFVRLPSNGDIFINEDRLKRLALEKFDDI